MIILTSNMGINGKISLWIVMLFGCSFLYSCKKAQTESQSVKSTELAVISDPIDLDLDQIILKGTLKAIVDNSSTSYFIYKGQPMGYEYELLSLLANELGLKLELIITSNIDEAFEKLNSGEGDIIAYTLTVTKDRRKKVAFTKSHYTVRQVLVQMKPDNWRNMKLHEIEKLLIRNQVSLIGKEVHVRGSSSYLDRLRNLSNEIGGDIIILEDQLNLETEALIKMVAQGEIKYTIADEDVAMVNATYYPDIDIQTPISFPQQIAWALRRNAKQLKDTIDWWIDKMKRGPVYNVIYTKYFKSPRTTKLLAQSNYASFSGDNLSPYDDLIKVAADSLGWDWRLFASMAYQESKFDANVISWAGARGLMQMMPATGLDYGANDLLNPEQNISAAVKYLKYLNHTWKDRVAHHSELIKFVLASYNVGVGHVLDARALATKYGKDPELWENVEEFLLKKSQPKYFRDPIVKSGYCRGEEPVNYVKEVLNRYQQYLQLINS